MKQQQERQSMFQKQQLLLLQTQKYTTLVKKSKIQINNSEDFVKILGIYSTNDLQITSNYNWELCILNLEKQLQ